jgi:hypothetical protein
VKTFSGELYGWNSKKDELPVPSYVKPVLLNTVKGVVDVICTEKRVYFLTAPKKRYNMITRVERFSDVIIVM